MLESVEPLEKSQELIISLNFLFSSYLVIRHFAFTILNKEKWKGKNQKKKIPLVGPLLYIQICFPTCQQQQQEKMEAARDGNGQ